MDRQRDTLDENIDEIMKKIERDSGKEIFTFKVLQMLDDALDIIAVFEDRSVMRGHIKIELVGDQIALRVQGNYI